MLYTKTTIQRYIAVMLVVIFAISITPATYFHSALAGHKDGITCKDPSTAGAHFHQKQVECHFDQLVVTTPYLFHSFSINFSVALLYPEHTNLYTFSFKKLHYSHKSSRGPPQAQA